MVKTIILVLLLLSGISVESIQGATSAKELLSAPENTSLTSTEYLEKLTNSMDSTRGTAHVEWAKKLYEEALVKKSEYHKEEALREIIAYYVNKDIKDTARYYIAEAEKTLKEGEYKDYMLTFMRTILAVRVVYYEKNEEADSLIAQALLRLKGEVDMPEREKVSDYYLLGMLAAARSETNYAEKSKEVIGYLDKVIQKTEKLPVRIGMLFRPNTFFVICGNVLTPEERVPYALRYLEMLEKYRGYLATKNRSFLNQRHFLNAYGMLACSSKVLGKDKASDYYNKFVELNRKYPQDASFTPTYEYLYTTYNYYVALDDKKKVIEIADSMVAHLCDMGMEAHAAQYLEEKISVCDSLHWYKEAYESYKKYNELQEIVRKTNNEANAKENAINQKVDELLIEKKTLEAEKSRIQVFLLLTLFVLAICTILYIVSYLRKTKGLNKQLQETNDKLLAASARLQESEKTKYAFLRNLCNEIFTPLNAIKGFSDFLLDNKVDEAEKQTFLKIISDHSDQISRMMEDILEIVRLESSSGVLPSDWTNLHTLCKREVDDLKRDSARENVEYLVEGDPEHDTICTNQTYFCYVLGQLLNTVNMVTELGQIIVSYELLPEKKIASVYVTATGKVMLNNDHSGDSSTDVAMLVCKMIAERMNAKLKKDTDFAEGLRFVFELPL